LLTAQQEVDVEQRLTTDFLRTTARQAMWDAIDGRRGSPEIARLAQASERAAQMFVKELLDAGLVQSVEGATGRGLVVEKNDDAIVRWYLRRSKGVPS
jgi:DNA-binding IscR family transcriptional regulator